MYTHILLPVDLSDGNAHALRRASELASGPETRVTLLHVIERIEHVPENELRGFYDELTRTAEGKLSGWARELARCGAKVEVQVVEGKRSLELLRYASEHGCDLVVMASRPVSRERPAGSLGTISQQVGLLAECDVLLVRS